MNKQQLETKNKLVKILEDNGYTGLKWQKFAEGFARNPEQWNNTLTYLLNLAEKKEGK